MTASISRREITVRFDPGARKVLFGGKDIDDKGRIGIPTGIGLIVFRLIDLVDGAERPCFPSDPIQWVVQDGERWRPVDTPRAFEVRRLSETNTTVQVVNSTLADEEHPFFVIIQTAAGEFFGTDPTIVTMRPGEGGEDGVSA